MCWIILKTLSGFYPNTSKIDTMSIQVMLLHFHRLSHLNFSLDIFIIKSEIVFGFFSPIPSIQRYLLTGILFQFSSSTALFRFIPLAAHRVNIYTHTHRRLLLLSLSHFFSSVVYFFITNLNYGKIFYEANLVTNCIFNDFARPLIL